MRTVTKLVFSAATIAALSAHSSVVGGAQMTEALERAPAVNQSDATRTGRIAGVPIDRAGTAIAPSGVDVMTLPRESQVAGPAAAALAAPPPGTIDGKVLAAEIAARFEPLEGCRVDVARRRHAQPHDIAADRLTLRWTIGETGRVAAAEVVGTTAVDADVLDCVKRRVNEWTFTRPSGGPLPVERIFIFRHLPPGDDAARRIHTRQRS